MVEERGERILIRKEREEQERLAASLAETAANERAAYLAAIGQGQPPPDPVLAHLRSLADPGLPTSLTRWPSASTPAMQGTGDSQMSASEREAESARWDRPIRDDDDVEPTMDEVNSIASFPTQALPMHSDLGGGVSPTPVQPRDPTTDPEVWLAILRDVTASEPTREQKERRAALLRRDYLVTHGSAREQAAARKYFAKTDKLARQAKY